MAYSYWSCSTTYGKYDKVLMSDGRKFESGVDDNVNNNPVDGTCVYEHGKKIAIWSEVK